MGFRNWFYRTTGIQLKKSNKKIENTIKQNVKDYSLRSGERQVAVAIDDIRADHRFRYEMAYAYLDEKQSDNIMMGLDIFCGTGYGSYMLSKKYQNLYMLGIDGSSEGIYWANDHYGLRNNLFSYKLYPFSLPSNQFDLITCFESLEHVEDDKGLFLELFNSLKKGGILFVSVPNQKLHNLEKNENKYHFRHYLHQDVIDKFGEKLELLDWYGQNVYNIDRSSEEVLKNDDGSYSLLSNEEMTLTKGEEGQVNIYVFKK